MAAEVQRRLQELRAIEMDLAEDIHALEKAEVAPEDLAEHLHAVRGLIDEGYRVLQNARAMVDELEVAQSCKELRERLSQEKHELQRMEAMIPPAVRAAKAKFAANERGLLLEGASDRSSKMRDEQQHLHQSMQITESLQHTRSMMTREIHRGNEAYEMLKSQGVQLEGLSDLHVDYNAKVSVGRRLITLISRKETLEKVVVFASFAWFVAVVLYIVYARLMPASAPAAAGASGMHAQAPLAEQHPSFRIPPEDL